MQLISLVIEISIKPTQLTNNRMHGETLVSTGGVGQVRPIIASFRQRH